MKKTFTLFCALLCVSAMVQAQNDLTYNFSSSAFADYQANAGTALSQDIAIDDYLTFYDNTGKFTWETDGLNYFTGVEYPYRVKVNGGWGGSSTYKACIGIKVSGPCTIQFVVTSSSSDAARDLLIYEDTGSEFDTQAVQTFEGAIFANTSSSGMTVEDATITYEYKGSGSAEIIIGDQSSGWNIFFLGVYYGTVSAPETGSNAISSIQADGAVEVARYNLLGQEISQPQKGINIVKYSNGATEKVLVK